MTISNKHGIYELPHKLPNNLRLRDYQNYGILGKCKNFVELLPSAQSSSQNGNFINTSKNLLKNRNWAFHMKTRVCLKYFVHGCWTNFTLAMKSLICKPYAGSCGCSGIFIFDFNVFMAKVPIIWKSVYWFAMQINGLVSIW